MNRTDNYGLNLPGQDDYYDVDVFNENTAAIDDMLCRLERAIEAATPKTKELIATFTQSDEFRPADYGVAGVEADVYLVGGGGGGGANSLYGGGGGGYCRMIREVLLDQESYPIVVGRGGAVTGDGGSTTAFGQTAAGGKGVVTDSAVPLSQYRGGDGGSGGGGGWCDETTAGGTGRGTLGGDGGAFGGGGGGMGGSGGGNVDYCPINPYDGIAYGCGGGGGRNGKGGGAGGAGYYGDDSLTVSAGRANGYLGGGGGARGGEGGYGGGGGGAGGAGGSGIVYIYT